VSAAGFHELLVRDRALPLHVPALPGDAVVAAAKAAAAGLGTLEIALRSDAAEEALALAVGGTVLVGAGTVIDTAQVDRVVSAGAGFIVTPGFHLPVVQRCLELGIPVLPGVATGGEIMAALSLGVSVVKLFPAHQLGGPTAIRALAGPFPQVRFVPSGGVTRGSAADYLALDHVIAISGSWLLEEDVA
jgi:2-dehydro-3-deoxyphosphogluconate aldolase/(4S)-4-hydroxy-2-oxoglutarate aldolase